MKIKFKYEIDKDGLNFIKGMKSINNPAPTKLNLLFNEESKDQEITNENVKKFIEGYILKNDIHVDEKVTEFQKKWGLIEEESIRRLEIIFKIKYPTDEVIAYLTTNDRCTYNIKEGFFFVNLNNLESNRTVIHELFHFYTWSAIHDELIKMNITELQYNDIKESLTVLLNVEFPDLLNGAKDWGYPQHQEMRKKILELWETEKDIKKLVLQLI